MKLIPLFSDNCNLKKIRYELDARTGLFLIRNYLNFLFLAASDFFLRLTLGFS